MSESDQLRPPTPTLDPTVAALTSQLNTASVDDTDDTQDDDLLEELETLEDGFDIGALREKRFQQLKEEMGRIKDMRETDHGRYTEVTDEKEVIKISAQESRCVIHFYHRDFRRCKIMDKHLETIAPKYFTTRFIRVFVENVPWLVEKLSIKVLPCVISFIGGVSKDRIIGFEELAGGDSFETTALELRLSLCGVIQKPKPTGPLQSMYAPNLRGKQRDEDDYDSDD